MYIIFLLSSLMQYFKRNCLLNPRMTEVLFITFCFFTDWLRCTTWLLYKKNMNQYFITGKSSQFHWQKWNLFLSIKCIKTIPTVSHWISWREVPRQGVNGPRMTLTLHQLRPRRESLLYSGRSLPVCMTNRLWYILEKWTERHRKRQFGPETSVKLTGSSVLLYSPYFFQKEIFFHDRPFFWG